MSEEYNWAGNYKYSSKEWHYPKRIEEIQQLVTRCNKIRVVGTRHSFNGIADSKENIISLEKLNKVISLDSDNKTVTVEAGIKYSDLAKYLAKEGYAIRNLASLPHISVAGACATATHGSGNKNSCLSTAVKAMDVVTADGTLVSFSREQNKGEMEGVVVGLGGLGVVTQLTLDIVPAYEIKQTVYENLLLTEFEHHFDDIYSSAYSVSSFTNWQDEKINQVWLKHYVTDSDSDSLEQTLFGASLAKEKQHPIQGLGTENCTDQLGVPGPWFDRLPHFRMDFVPSSGEELQSEYIMPRRHGYKALRAISEIREQIAPLLLVSEVRTIASDNLWMSPCYKEDSVGIHFTWKQDWGAVQKVLPKVEEQLTPFNAKPHWGKLFTMSPKQVQSGFEKIKDFKQLLVKYDPKGKFRNEFLDKYIFSEDES
ncbi:FAD-binding protein [Aquibacillus salsiterrae]|uniref:FAD-binding protein n=1 Tax=Aquibacillus salsiterrae TaxID=2950439 RepID=A0A9X4AEY7_9BACI|nr:FAD-binding protein [Aquibacillus salsiterrae]MDC3417442.1 FAD-binding protein [Aquibacillus salsiterrae]